MSLAIYALVGAGALIFHIAIGYPLILAVWRGRAQRVTKDEKFVTTVSVVMAVYNGGALIRRKLEALLRLDYPRDLLQIIVISDGSTDETGAIVHEFENSGVVLLTVPRGGKAAALNRGLEAACGEILFFTDVRQPLEPKCLRHLVANFADPTVGAVTGELVLLRGERGEQADMDLYWRYEVWARKRHTQIDSLFNTTGCIYAMRRELARPLAPDTLIDDAMLPQNAFFKGYRVIFDPEAIAYDYPAVAGMEFRRRFRTLAGLWQVFGRRPELFSGRNRMRFHFLSHKFGRLVLPWAILVFLISTIAMPASWIRSALLIAEGVWLALAACDRFLARGSALRRLSSPAKTLLVMNVAAMAAVAVFFIPANKLWTQAHMQTTPAEDRSANREVLQSEKKN
jgi:cellulose synthase/poly-beta-1,6-N-acetylglucosamine synthase-like glycosyltransferase